MKKTFFVTTPIYYTNGVPHIGHSYSSIIADVLSTYKKISGFDIKFGTGVDENSQKAVLKAEEEGLKVEDYLDIMAAKHKAVWDGLKINYTDFIRTTEERHHKLVREVLQKSFDAGDIYEGVYEGLYCVGCEAFKKDDDLIEKDGKKVCADHLKEPEKLKEKNYFFRLSKYQDKILEFYEKNPDFVTPKDRFNEVIAFVKRGLEDFSISRETNKFGIKLPFDEAQVTYVWYDALFNYVTICQNGDERFWPADLHVVGKDIIRFHAIYWPAMLMSAGYELPKQILTTGFFTVDGQKISKSLGNVIDPVEFSEKYSKDLLVLYLLSSFNIGQDGDFDQTQAILTYNAKLANNLGNLLNRASVLTLKLELENGFENVEFDKNIFELLKNYENVYKNSFEKYELKAVLDSTFKFLDDLNLFVTEKEPWKLMKNDETLSEAKNILFTICESLRQVGLNLFPFFPEKMTKLFETLGLKNYFEDLQNGKLEELKNRKENFKITEKPEILFEKFEV
ncbi:methionine--tRNA ligase [Candidatus Gracilibacteria bacterium]|nr:MAG: methionine--tRNA ligase [Candidatus Gracilibacteria bacterium]